MNATQKAAAYLDSLQARGASIIEIAHAREALRAARAKAAARSAAVMAAYRARTAA